MTAKIQPPSRLGRILPAFLILFALGQAASSAQDLNCETIPKTLNFRKITGESSDFVGTWVGKKGASICDAAINSSLSYNFTYVITFHPDGTYEYKIGEMQVDEWKKEREWTRHKGTYQVKAAPASYINPADCPYQQYRYTITLTPNKSTITSKLDDKSAKRTRCLAENYLLNDQPKTFRYRASGEMIMFQDLKAADQAHQYDVNWNASYLQTKAYTQENNIPGFASRFFFDF